MNASGYDVAVLKGDGIDPESVHAALAILERAGRVRGVRLRERVLECGPRTCDIGGAGRTAQLTSASVAALG